MRHPNRRAFTGVLTRLDEPSDGPLCGAKRPEEKKGDARRVILPASVARNALHSLIGMPVNWKEKMNHHAVTRIGGIITDADIEGQELVVAGYVFSHNLLVEVPTLQRDDLGMSFESTDAHIADMNEEIWRIARLTFTGATVIKQNCAAYRKTRFTLLPGDARVPVSLAVETGTLLSI